MALRAARKLHQKLPGALLDKLLFGKHICKSPLCHWESLTRTAHQGPGFAVTAGSRFSKVPVSRSGTLSRAEAALQPCNSGAARWQHLVAAAGCAGRRVYATSSAAAGRAGAAAGAAEVLGFGKPGGGGGGGGLHPRLLLPSSEGWSFGALLAAARHYSRCYYELSKARLSFLVVTTASAGFVLGSGNVVDWAGLGWTSLGTLLAASSANAVNQVMEVRNDGAMRRTMRRPLPTGRLSRAHALAFAATAGVAGIALLASKANEVTAALGAGNIALYTMAYTPLKQLHPVNTWVGALVGAIPPLMGWAAAAGGLGPGAFVLAGVLYFWQLPHFMALAWMCRKDYAAGGYKMLSMLDATGRRTAGAALRNCVYLLPIGAVAAHLNTTSDAFTYENLILSGGLGLAALGFYKTPTSASARSLFRCSLLYLPLTMAAMVVHRQPNLQAHSAAKHAESLAVAMERQHVPAGESSAIGREKLEGDRSGLRGGRGKYGWEGAGGAIDARAGWSEKFAPRPPIDFMSAAPFPFLPAPQFGSRI